MIELLAKSILENKEEIRMFPSNNNGIGFENYLKRTINGSKNFGRFRTQKISDVFDYGQNFFIMKL